VGGASAPATSETQRARVSGGRERVAERAGMRRAEAEKETEREDHSAPLAAAAVGWKSTGLETAVAPTAAVSVHASSWVGMRAV
jgi:hypothetical protein